MIRRQPNNSNLACGTVIALVALAAAAPALGQRYWIEELPPVPGYPRSAGYGINNAGVVSGVSLDAAAHGPLTRWDLNGMGQNLGGWPNVGTGRLSDVSGDGSRIVGGAYPNTYGIAFSWVEDASPPLAALPVPAGNWGGFSGFKINNAGTLAAGGLLKSNPYAAAACCWEYENPGGHWQWTLTELLPLPTWPFAIAMGINNAGVIVGASVSTRSYGVACRWDWVEPNWVPTELVTPNPVASRVFVINDLNQYAGDYDPGTGGPVRSFFYDGSQCIPLGVPPGYESYPTLAQAINNAGTVLLWAGNTGNSLDPINRGCVWRRGVLTRLQDALIGGAGWTVGLCADINERGQIAGIGWHNGVLRAVRLTPAYGDLNCDGALNGSDIQPFVLALTDPAGYDSQYPDCDTMNADFNADGVVDGNDIALFVERLLGG